MRGRRATRGILSTMAKGSRGKQRPPRRTILQSIGFWLGAVAIVAVGVVIVVAFVSQLFAPPDSLRRNEADAVIVEISAPPSGSPEMIVAGAVIEIERRRVTIPLTAPQREGLTAGAVLHVKYTAIPSLGTVRVDRWERKLEEIE